MAIRTGQNQLANFTRPSQNERPITSAVVRGLANTIGAAFNVHDADQSLHVQSGVLADRPLAGTLGRVYVTYDVPTAPLIWLDNGVSWVSQSADWATISNRPTDFPPAPHSATLITTGVLSDARLSGNVPRLNQINSFSTTQSLCESLTVGPSSNPAAQTAFVALHSVAATPDVRSGYVGFASLDSTLRVQNEVNGDILLSTASTSITLKPSGRFEIPSGLVKLGAINYTWPLADGTSGQVLKTDGAGTLSWVTDVGGGGGGGPVAWVDITGRPATFSPSAHTHTPADIQAGTLPSGVLLAATQLLAGAIPSGVTLPYGQLSSVPSAFPPAAHNQAWSTITGVPTYLPADWNTTLFNRPTLFPPQSHNHDWSQITTGVPSSFPPSAHTHLWAQITDKPTTFTPSAHSHVIGDVASLQAILDQKTVQGGTGTFANGTVGGNALAGIIVSTSVPSGSAIQGTIWARV